MKFCYQYAKNTYNTHRNKMCSTKYALAFSKLETSENNLEISLNHSMILASSTTKLSVVLMKHITMGVVSSLQTILYEVVKIKTVVPT